MLLASVSPSNRRAVSKPQLRVISSRGGRRSGLESGWESASSLHRFKAVPTRLAGHDSILKSHKSRPNRSYRTAHASVPPQISSSSVFTLQSSPRRLTKRRARGRFVLPVQQWSTMHRTTCRSARQSTSITGARRSGIGRRGRAAFPLCGRQRTARDFTFVESGDGQSSQRTWSFSLWSPLNCDYKWIC
jgi:hypothetical protein